MMTAKILPQEITGLRISEGWNRTGTGATVIG
jgi:hypothetical protein